jgi:hypothetical protein
MEPFLTKEQYLSCDGDVNKMIEMLGGPSIFKHKTHEELEAELDEIDAYLEEQKKLKNNTQKKQVKPSDPSNNVI